MLLRRLVDGHSFGHIDQVQAADNPLPAANGNGNRGDFLLLLPAAKVFTVAVLPGAFENGGQFFRLVSGLCGPAAGLSRVAL